MVDCHAELMQLLQQERLAGASLLVFANKQDLPGALNTEQVGQALELDQIKQRHWKVQSCSAVTGDGLVEGMDWLVQDISSRIFIME